MTSGGATAGAGDGGTKIEAGGGEVESDGIAEGGRETKGGGEEAAGVGGLGHGLLSSAFTCAVSAGA